MKKVLILIPFSNIYPPMNGGMLRCFNLLNQLCKYFEVTALINQNKESFLKSVEEFPSLKDCNLLSTTNNKIARNLYSLVPVKYRDSVRYRVWNRSLKGKAETNYLIIYPQLKEFLRSNKVDIIIFEDMSIINLAKLVKQYQPDITLIYDAHNVNSILAATAYENGIMGKKQYNIVFNWESSLYHYVKNIFACSAVDLKKLIDLNLGKISGAVIPNGIKIPVEPINENEGWKSMDMLFCGSLDYFPNQEGLIWFCTEVFPVILQQLPTSRLLVVGKGNPGNKLKLLLDNPSIINYGKVDRVDSYYRKSAMAIIPLLSGSGTRLKLLEAMSFKIPVLSTTLGAEGIFFTDSKDILIADGTENFAYKAIELLKNPSLAKTIVERAFDIVRHEYDWDTVGIKMKDYLNSLRD